MAIEVKICGVRSVEIAAAAIDAGADDIGVVFFPKSPRNVTLAEASAIAAYARGRAAVVALTVDADDALLAAIAADVAPDLLQLHGSECPERCREIRTRWHIPVMKAIGVAAAGDIDHAAAYRQAADRILFDAKPPAGADVPGGNGLSFDWQLLAGVGRRMPFMLSGGLTQTNVAEAIAITGASGVDVSSGVEVAPGIKDVGRILRFITAAKAVDATA